MPIHSLASRNKTSIAQQFSHTAFTYDGAADVQLDIAFDAMTYVPRHAKNAVDIGCETGRISQQFVIRCNTFVTMDLAFGMLSYAQQNSTDNDSFIGWFN